MRHAKNFHPEWGFLAPAPSFMRTLRTVFVATAVGATYGQARTADHSPRPTSARWCSSSASKENSPQNQRAGTKNRVFLEGDKLEVAVKNGRWVLTHLPAKPPEPKPVLHYFPDE